MNTRRLLALIALPVMVGTFGCVALNQAIAQSPNRVAQNSSQPNQQQEGRRHRGPDFAAAAQKLPCEWGNKTSICSQPLGN